MAMVKKSISVTDQQDHWIKAQIETGNYGNESEVFRELIRERQMRERESQRDLELIRRKLQSAEVSGFIRQSPDELLKEIKDGLGKDGLQT